ncbi:helix-turn-helix domain-containing protein [Pseudomonas sp. HTZ1]|uniref:helix-turn-helix domain-containing protein n=1 Tax=Pseudomonas sp. HTZ1 TaxID=3075219 RepID=UPI00287F19D2|nr:helix-turn-helix domain-containing protein [Pseudomonas sp. HTZ1]MDS9589726.1 helix-turn-helix domain-containing protein [Pseudomonas sp. HTZ1]
MSLRKAYAATLQWLRVRRGLSQSDLQNQADQAHISRLEASTTSASVDLTAGLADALGVTPLSFFTLLAAANEGKTPRAALIETLAELQMQGLLDESLPAEPQKLPPPRQVAAAEKLRAVRELKEAGLTQAEVSKKLGLPTSTVGRLWHAIENR